MKRRFIQSREPPYDFVEVTEIDSPRFDGLLYNDRSYWGLRASDGADISSRTKHREYMRKHGLTTMDDYKNMWDREQQQRTEYFTTGKGGAVSKQDIEKAINTLESHRRRQ